MDAKLYIFASFLFCLLGVVVPHAVISEDSSTNARVTDISSRVLNGIEMVSEEDFPHQAAVLEKKRHVCGGSILNDQYVLTVASCVTNSNGKAKSTSDIQIGVGSVNLNYYYFNDSTYHNVSKIIVHGSYNQSTLLNNIALIRIQDYFEFSKTVFPIPLATAVPSDYASKCIVSGWGAIWTNPAAPDMHHLHAVPVNVTRCTGITVPSTGVLCATSTGNGVCEGDKGGPLICDPSVLMGLVSHSNCKLGISGAYTSIPYFTTWIENTLNPSMVARSSAIIPSTLTAVLVLTLACGVL